MGKVKTKVSQITAQEREAVMRKTRQLRRAMGIPIDGNHSKMKQQGVVQELLETDEGKQQSLERLRDKLIRDGARDARPWRPRRVAGRR